MTFPYGTLTKTPILHFKNYCRYCKNFYMYQKGYRLHIKTCKKRCQGHPVLHVINFN